MANGRNLTAANSVVVIGVTSLFPVPQVVDEFESDNPFALEDVTVAETALTLDGTLLGGYIPSTVTWTLTLQPTSNSKPFFVDWMQASKTDQTIYTCFGNVTIPDEKANYTFKNGIIISGAVMPSVRKILQPVQYKIQFSSRDIIAVGI